MIIGITGTLAAGKGTIVEYLQTKGFKHYSTSEFITEEIVRRNMPVNRESMIIVGNDLRAKFGPGYIAEECYKRAKEVGGDSVIESLRTEGEINTLKDKEEFYLLSVDANQDIRYFRAIERKSEKDSVDLETFKENENREMTTSDPTKQNLSRCIELSNFKIRNNGTIKELYSKVEVILNEISKSKEVQKEEGYIRPSWDEYFMEIVHAVAKRGTCNRGRTGCVIVKDKQILATGYVGSAAGQPHCDDVGHLMEETIHADGVKRPHCVRTIHAEQNAICQAAKNGISIKGATIYCKLEPCSVCARMLVNSGIKRVMCEKRYAAAQESRKIFKMAGVEVVSINEEVEKY